MKSDLILYDGECGLCDRTVQFVLARDRQDRYVFAPLQSSVGQEQAAKHGLDTSELSSFILIEDYAGSSRAYLRAKAALRVCRHLGWQWQLLSIFGVLPAWLIDPFYNFVARRRIKWFGRLESCRLPSPEQRAKFLA
jgi:predicted DCC family thiol-disulfide oxidoreductase YuxK